MKDANISLKKGFSRISVIWIDYDAQFAMFTHRKL